MKIAILYICTGRYNMFWDGFYKSSEEYFLKDEAEKEYFVFTDNMDLCKDSRVHLHYRECQGFPFDSLFRFELFLSIENEIKDFDYIYFFNANAQFLAPVGNEMLPDETGLAAALWPHNHAFLNHSFFYPYERNKESLAYIPPFDGPYYYFMGGINGGRRKDYLAMVKELNNNIASDYEKGIVAVVHDESHINHYLHHHKCKILPSELAWPEDWKASVTPRLIFRDKKCFGDYFVKGRDRSFKGKFKFLLKKIQWASSWYL